MLRSMCKAQHSILRVANACEKERGMKIASIETFLQEPVALTRVRADNGAEGWGQVSTFRAGITVGVLHEMIASYCLGRDVDGFEEHASTVVMKENKFTGTFVCRSVTGIDTALWDLRGKVENKSVADMLGAKSKRVRIYASDMKRDTTLDEQIERFKPFQDEKGVTVFKYKLGPMGEFGLDKDTFPGRTEAIIPHMREHLGPDVELIADANSCFSVPKAIEVGHVLEETNHSFFEEPVSWWDIEGTAKVNAALSVPVCGGEQDFQLPQWERLIGMDAVEVVQPDVCYVGGFSRTLEVAKLAQKRGKRCMPHSANHSLVTLFAMNAMAVIPNPGPYGEFNINCDSWCANLFEPQLEVKDGHVALPEGPGWGVTVNPDWLKKAQCRESKA
jgi:L-alanine-DL-glutamate epimerase-like enolase superfamily enzyme